MTAYRFVTLTCDECGEIWDDGGISQTFHQARRVAKHNGWTYVFGRDECPRHGQDDDS